MTHGIYIKIRKLKRNEKTAITADINKSVLSDYMKIAILR